jgi:magnesium-transporting ATPase (P-type)
LPIGTRPSEFHLFCPDEWIDALCSLFSYSLILGYSLIFTSLPVAVLGAFEQDVPAEASLAYPALYKRGILGLEYTKSMYGRTTCVCRNKVLRP